jgi:DNA-directed RNA polymerase subunit RPC12/RpoP
LCEQERKAALRRRKKPKQTAGDRWAARILKKYGLTPDDVALRWAEQDGRCPICGCDLTTKVWVIDHDHRKTGRDSFRGVVCAYCNHRILGMAERGGFVRAVNVVKYLWPGRTAA